MEQGMPDPLRKLKWRGIRGRTALKATCAQCGETQNVEMHHVRGLKYIKTRNPVDIIMMSARRKQIPLCQECHKKVHGD